MADFLFVAGTGDAREFRSDSVHQFTTGSLIASFDHDRHCVGRAELSEEFLKATQMLVVVGHHFRMAGFDMERRNPQTCEDGYTQDAA